MMDLATDGRREAIRLALAAAEVCWLVPAFLAVSRTADLHPALLVWLGFLVLYLAYSLIYRALVAAHLKLWLQQALLVLVLLLSIVLLLRFHVYAGAGLHGIEWLLAPIRHLADEMVTLPGAWIAILALVYLWLRGINLARRSLSVESVGFSFRLGILIFVGVALVASRSFNQDVSGFIVPFFFLGLVAVALARVEEVSQVPNSSHVGFSGFWIGSTVGAVGLLILVGSAVALFFYGGGLRQALHLLSPVWVVVQIVIAAIGVVLLALVQGLLDLFSIDLSLLGEGVREALQRLGSLANLGQPFVPAASPQARPAWLGVLQVVVMVGIPIVAVVIVVVVTWNRVRRGRRTGGDETHESLPTAGALANSLRAMLAAGRDRLGELAGLMDRFGLGARFLSAISIRRIYANLVRLATAAGYPRAETQTPYEYLRTLYKALPGSDADVAAITVAYVNAHYGNVPDNREDLQEIHDCWERVRARQAERLKSKTSL
jgi:hypothetical protein